MAPSVRRYDSDELAERFVGGLGERDDRDGERHGEQAPRAFWFAFDPWSVARREEPGFVLA